MNNSDLIAACKQIYAETNGIYLRYRQQLGVRDLGFKILYGPPCVNPHLLFIGDQPAGKIADEKPNERYSWPSRCEYATETWTLARNMQSMFGAAFLADCVGVNANFFRAPDSESWNAVPPNVRDILEKFCAEKLATMISLMAPKQIVTIGFSVLNKFGPSDPILFGAKQRVLMRRGKFGRWPAVSALHLSGAQIGREDRVAIANTILQLTQHGLIPAAGHESTETPRKPVPPNALSQFVDSDREKQKGSLVGNAPITSTRGGVGVLRAVEAGSIGPEDTKRIII